MRNKLFIFALFFAMIANADPAKKIFDEEFSLKNPDVFKFYRIEGEGIPELGANLKKSTQALTLGAFLRFSTNPAAFSHNLATVMLNYLPEEISYSYDNLTSDDPKAYTTIDLSSFAGGSKTYENIVTNNLPSQINQAFLRNAYNIKGETANELSVNAGGKVVIIPPGQFNAYVEAGEEHNNLIITGSGLVTFAFGRTPRYELHQSVFARNYHQHEEMATDFELSSSWKFFIFRLQMLETNHMLVSSVYNFGEETPVACCTNVFNRLERQITEFHKDGFYRLWINDMVDVPPYSIDVFAPFHWLGYLSDEEVDSYSIIGHYELMSREHEFN